MASKHEEYKSYQRGLYSKNPESYKWRVRCKTYNITKEQFFEMLSKQDNKCALCDNSFKSIWGNSLHVDHCHEENKVRGLLCMGCNVGLGMLGDNEAGLVKALKYVRGEL